MLDIQTVSDYNHQFAPMLNNAQALLLRIDADHGDESVGAKIRLAALGWSDEMRSFLMDALDAYKQKTLEEVKQNDENRNVFCVRVDTNCEPLSFGQTVYAICDAGSKTFSEKCPVCDDTQKITVRGFEMDCPYCKYGRRMDDGSSAQSLTLRDYKVVDYVIHKVTVKGPAVKSAYYHPSSIGGLKLGETAVVYFEGFTKRRGAVECRSFDAYDIQSGDLPEKLSDRSVGCAFERKADCVAYVKRLHDLQKAALDKFNAEHGTAHEYPFTY